MAINLRCCFCDVLLEAVNERDYECPKCKTTFKTKERIAQLASNPPQFIQDSIEVYKDLQTSYPKITLAKHPMFTPEFSKNDVSKYTSCTKQTVNEIQNNWHLIQEDQYLSAGISDMAITSVEASQDVHKAFIPFSKCDVEKYIYLLMVGRSVSRHVKYNSHLTLEYYSAMSMEQLFLLNCIHSFDKYYAGFSRITNTESRDEYLLYSLSRRIYDGDTKFLMTGHFIDKVDNWFKDKVTTLKRPVAGTTKAKLAEHGMDSEFYNNNVLQMLMRSTPALFIFNSLSTLDTLWVPHLNGIDMATLMSISPDKLKTDVNKAAHTLQVNYLLAKKFCSQAAFEIYNHRVISNWKEYDCDPDLNAFRFWDYVRVQYL